MEFHIIILNNYSSKKNIEGSTELMKIRGTNIQNYMDNSSVK